MENPDDGPAVSPPRQRPPGAPQSKNPVLAAMQRHHDICKAKVGTHFNRPVGAKKLDEWWGEWLSLVDNHDAGDPEAPRVWKAHALWLQEDHWRAKGYPFAGFMSQAPDFVARVRAGEG